MDGLLTPAVRYHLAEFVENGVPIQQFAAFGLGRATLQSRLQMAEHLVALPFVLLEEAQAVANGPTRRLLTALGLDHGNPPPFLFEATPGEDHGLPVNRVGAPGSGDKCHRHFDPRMVPTDLRVA